MKGLSGWVRVGAANADAQIVGSYFGAGIVAQGILANRPDDRFGIGLARAGIGALAKTALGLSRAETTVEASYQYKVHNTLAVQPDLQFVHHPSGVSGARDALVLGLRFVVTAGYPRQAPATEAADPTVPPEGPQPADSARGSPPH
jgi:porin